MGALINELETFIILYFGINSLLDKRDTYFDELCYKTTNTDDEYFEKLKNINIGDLKGANVAMCTERAALAQNILSLFGIESYYCIGCLKNEENEEIHAFNIARAKDTFMLLDYSVPVSIYENNKVIKYVPFQGKIDIDKIENVLLNGVDKEYENYEYIKTIDGLKKSSTNSTRSYLVGSISFENNKQRQI